MLRETCWGDHWWRVASAGAKQFSVWSGTISVNDQFNTEDSWRSDFQLGEDGFEHPITQVTICPIDVKSHVEQVAGCG